MYFSFCLDPNGPSITCPDPYEIVDSKRVVAAEWDEPIIEGSDEKAIATYERGPYPPSRIIMNAVVMK